MDGLGSLIKALRKEKGMSVEALSEGVCTVRYFYMIENESKNPSFEIVKKLNDKFGLNIFDYIDYWAFEKPLSSKFYVDEVRKLRYRQEYKELRALTNEMLASQDSDKMPLKAEILCNQVILAIFEIHDLPGALHLANESLVLLTGYGWEYILENSLQLSDITVISLLNCVFVIHKMSGNDRDAYTLLLHLKGCLDRLISRKEFSVLYSSITINYFLTRVFTHEESISEDELFAFLGFQIDHQDFDRVFLTYYVMSISNYYTKNYVLAKHYFEKCVTSGLGTGLGVHFKNLVNSFPHDYFMEMSPTKTLTINLNEFMEK
jgi:transcriptional regulator with XRE-family HTH domain